MWSILLSVAMAAEPLDEIVWRGDDPLFDARFVEAAGQTHIALSTSGHHGGGVLLSPTEGGWAARLHPHGAVVASDAGLHLVQASSEPGHASGVWRLGPDGVAPEAALPDALPVGHHLWSASWTASGQLELLIGDGVYATLLRPHVEAWEGPTWPANDVILVDGQVWRLEPERVVGPRTWARPTTTAEAIAFDESPLGAPLFVAAEARRLVVWHGGTRSSHALPPEVLPDPATCQAAPCTETQILTAPPGHGRYAFTAGGAIVPFAITTRVTTQTCQPGRQYACDPVGPVNNCPTDWGFDCRPTAPPRETTALHVLTASGPGSAVTSVPWDGGAARLMDTRALPDGRVQILVEGSSGRGPRALHLIHLTPEPGQEPARARYPTAVQVDAISHDALTGAGVSVAWSRDPNHGIPAWEDGALRSGGGRGLAWMTVPLITLPGEAREQVTVTVSAEVGAAPSDCSPPTVQIDALGRQVLLELSGEHAVLRDGIARTRQVMDAPGAGAHAWTLTVTRDQATLSVDDAPVGAFPLTGAWPAPRWGVTVGQHSRRCGAAPAPEVRWTRLGVAAE